MERVEVANPERRLFLFHGWGASGRWLHEDIPGIDELAARTKTNCYFPDAKGTEWGRPAWQDAAEEGEADRLRWLGLHNSVEFGYPLPCYLGGYSDGAGFANYVGAVAPSGLSFEGIFSYSGRMQGAVNSVFPCRVCVVWNWELRQFSRQGRHVADAYERAGHPVASERYFGWHVAWRNGRLAHAWHPRATALLGKLLVPRS